MLQILREDHLAARDMSGGHDERVPEGEAEAVLDRPGDLEALDVDRRRTPRRRKTS
jgi:hypothetical protein